MMSSTSLTWLASSGIKEESWARLVVHLQTQPAVYGFGGGKKKRRDDEDDY